jgi:preprotein translocase subunit SecA
MNDVAETFTDRFLKVQLVIEEGPDARGAGDGGPFRGGDGDGSTFEPVPTPPAAPKRRYNALGVLEDIPADVAVAGTDEVVDVGPAETPAEKPAAARRDPVIVGAGRARSMREVANQGQKGPVDWSTVGRNDPCPCGSGKKFKKCHGAAL